MFIFIQQLTTSFGGERVWGGDKIRSTLPTSALGASNLVTLGASRLAMRALVLLVSLFATAVTPDSAMRYRAP